MGQAFYRETDTPTVTDKSEIAKPLSKFNLSLLHPEDILSEPVSIKQTVTKYVTGYTTTQPVCCPELEAYRPKAITKPSSPCAFVLPNGCLRIGHRAYGNIYWLGECEYDDGNTYYGDWINGKRHGLGKLTEPNGCTYYGWWENDLRHGLGEATFADGTTYDGDWVRDQKHGVGALIQVHKFVTQFPNN